MGSRSILSEVTVAFEAAQQRIGCAWSLQAVKKSRMGRTQELVVHGSTFGSRHRRMRPLIHAGCHGPQVTMGSRGLAYVISSSSIMASPSFGISLQSFSPRKLPFLSCKDKNLGVPGLFGLRGVTRIIPAMKSWRRSRPYAPIRWYYCFPRS